MKLKCIIAHTDPSTGFFGFGAVGRKSIDGLTEGKTYRGTPVAIVQNVLGATSIAESDYQFLIFNDNNEWVTYNLNLFEPI